MDVSSPLLSFSLSITKKEINVDYLELLCGSFDDPDEVMYIPTHEFCLVFIFVAVKRILIQPWHFSH